MSGDLLSSPTGQLPRHIGIIMDGNGRWANKRNLPRSTGHKEGLNAAKKIVQAAAVSGIGYLSLYTFSTENWKRTEDEISFLMGLIGQHLRKEFDFYRTHRIRVVHSGDIMGLPGNIQKEIAEVTRDTANNTGLSLNLAINYGGRDEIVRAVNRISRLTGPDFHKITEKDISNHTDCPDFPEVDLLIRTGGEMRISNFLLWESSYAELYFDEKLWPDWDASDLEAAISDFQKRQRRFGGLT